MRLPFDCYEALRARDSRFDGQFFVGVKTTGIYCRSVCPARTPKASSCLFFETAAAAEQAAFRPCLRCRPELAPHTPAASLEQALYAAIRTRAIHGDSVSALATRTGFSPRQLRRVMVRAFGVTPVEIMQTERLLFAKKLLQETSLRAAHIAHSAGFGSLRRFNALFQKRYGLAPTALRRQGRPTPEVNGAGEPADVLRLRLAYRAPLAWGEMLAYLARRAVAGVERVSLDRGEYARTVLIDGHSGWVSVRQAGVAPWLEVSLPAELAEISWEILARLRAMFDLDANPVNIDTHLAADPLLASSVQRHPGLRVPGTWSVLELALRAVLGQQVSVAGASTLAARLATKFGRPVKTPHAELNRQAPDASGLARATPAEIAKIGLPRARAATIHQLAVAAEDGRLDFSPGVSMELATRSLRTIPGIGAWTAQYIALRALRFPDAFPAGDLGLRKAVAGPDQPLPSEKATAARAVVWRPWRAYAAMHLWQTLHDSEPL